MIKSLFFWFGFFFSSGITAQISIIAPDIPHTQDFNSLVSSGTSTILPTGWLLMESGAGANTTYTANNGASTTSDSYSYGATSASDRSLGELTGIPTTTLGANFTNNTGATITSLLIHYTGEQWRLGATGRLDKLDFEYSTNATSLSTGTWTAVNNLDFNAPINSGIVGSLDGNLTSNRTPLGHLVTGLSIANGASFWIRWLPSDATGSDDGLSIDDFAITANPATHYTITTTGNNVIITDAAGNGETMNFYEASGFVKIFAPGRTFTLNAGPVTAMPATIIIAGQNSFSINGGNGNDIINVGAFATNLPSLTINGGTGDDAVNFTGNINFISNANLDVDLQDDAGAPGVDQVTVTNSADLVLSGTGIAEIKVSRNISFATGTTLLTSNGAIILEANQQVTPTSGAFVGINLNNALVQATQTGTITVAGKGGNSGGSQSGVVVDAGADIMGGTSGTVSVTGVGGAGTASLNMGVYVNTSGSMISSNGGNVIVTGTGGGTGVAGSCIGVQVSGGLISAGGSGTVTVTGTGAPGVTGPSNDGIRVIASNTQITSSGGNVTVTGVGGGSGISATNTGVTISTNAVITAGGSGTVKVTGTAGPATGSSQIGVNFNLNGSITSSSGAITVIGTGGANGSSSCHGIHLGTGTIWATGAAAVQITAHGGGTSGNTNHGLYVTGLVSAVSTVNGFLFINATGGGNGLISSSNNGIFVENGAAIQSTGNGLVSIIGTAGSTFGSNNTGVLVSINSAKISSNSGDLIIDGNGGGNAGSTSASNYGIGITSTGRIITGTGGVYLNGQGGLGTGGTHYGIVIDGSNTQVKATDGTILMTGQGGGSGSGGNNYGVHISNAAIVSTSTFGHISISAYGGTSASNQNVGLSVSAADLITNDLGSIWLIGAGGTGAGQNNYGMMFHGGAEITAKLGQIRMDAIEGSGTNGVGIYVVNDTYLSTYPNGANIYLNSNSISFNDVLVAKTGNSDKIYLNTKDGGVEIHPGSGLGATVGGPLRWSDVVLDSLTTGTIVIGSDTSGLVNVLGNITRPGSTAIELISEEDIVFSSGTINTNGGTLLCNGGNDPKASKFPSNDIEANVSTMSFAGNLKFTINGPTPNTQYEQLNVTGAVNLSGSSLLLSGSYTPTANETFILINNDGADPIIGTFAGLPQNAGIPNFLNSGLPATISYTGGTGNDVVITVSNPDYIITTTGGNLVITDVLGLSDYCTVEENAGNLEFEASGRSFTMNGSVLTMMPATIPIAGINSITINVGNGDDDVYHYGFTTTLPSLTINGGQGDDQVYFLGILNFIENAHLNLDLQNDNPAPGTDDISFSGAAQFTLSGSGSAVIKASRTIYFSSGSGLKTENGNITIEANLQSTPSSGSFNGINLVGCMVEISGTGQLAISGKAGNGGALNKGVNIIFNSLIQGGTTGTATINGYGQPTSFGENHGVYIYSPGTLVTTLGADLIINGYGGGSGVEGDNHGIAILGNAEVTTGGNGDLILNGVGGGSAEHFDIGVSISGTETVVTTNNGNILIDGLGGGVDTASYAYGVSIFYGAQVKPGGNGHLTITGQGGSATGIRNNGVDLESNSVTLETQNGNLTITGTGGGTGTVGYNTGIHLGGTVNIHAGGIGNISMTGTGGQTGNYNVGIYNNTYNGSITTSGGNITMLGQGGGNANYPTNVGLHLHGGVMHAAGNGNISVTGIGGTTGGNGNEGIFYHTYTITTDNGNIQVTATANGTGTASGSGMRMFEPAIISAGGTGTVTVAGTSPATAGTQCLGLQMNSGNVMITSDGGDVHVSGTSLSSSGAINYGVSIYYGAKIECGGSGNTTVVGTAGGTGLNTDGVVLYGTNAKISSTGGNVFVTGIESASPNSIGIDCGAGSLITTGANGGNITLVTNSAILGGSISTPSGKAVTVKPLSNNVKVNLGLNSMIDITGGPLQLADIELDKITTGKIIIGDADTDTITVNGNVTRATATKIDLISASDIKISGGILNANGGNVFLDPGTTPSAVKTTFSPTDINTDTLSFGGDVFFKINGTTVNTQYDQCNVTGKVKLTGANLTYSGTHTPVAGNTFVIVNNDAAEPIIGTFNGLAEGDTIYNFLGSPLHAVISYVGGSGNDAVLNVVNPCVNPDIPTLVASPDTVCSGTPVNISITGGNLNGATQWKWYSNSCGGTPVGTGLSIQVTPSATTQYFVRGEGGCVTNASCGQIQVTINPVPDPAIQRTSSGPCYYTTNTFQPQAAPIAGATYAWNFGTGATPATASGYGPHNVTYTTAGSKTAKLVIHPNAPGAQCPDSSLLNFVIDNCPAQVIGRVMDINGNPIVNANVKLFADANTNGLPDTTVAIRNVFTSSLGGYSMANLLPGHYVIVQTQPVGWLSFDDGDSSNDNDVVGNIDSLDNIIPVSLPVLEVDSMNMFIEIPAPGGISGNVFDDFNQNMAPDPGEGIANVTVSLYNDVDLDGQADSGIPHAVTTTTGNGFYSFVSTPAGSYVLVETQPNDYISVKDFDPTADGDLVPNTNMTNDTLPLTLSNGETDMHNFFIDGTQCNLIVSNSNDNGYGSLRNAIECAQDGDTVRFHSSLSGLVIEITSGELVIDDDVVFLSALSPRVSIASGINGLFEIAPNTNVEFINLDIESGMGVPEEGAAFQNFGVLKLEDVAVRRNPLLNPGAYLVKNHSLSDMTLLGDCEFLLN